MIRAITIGIQADGKEVMLASTKTPVNEQLDLAKEMHRSGGKLEGEQYVEVITFRTVGKAKRYKFDRHGIAVLAEDEQAERSKAYAAKQPKRYAELLERRKAELKAAQDRAATADKETERLKTAVKEGKSPPLVLNQALLNAQALHRKAAKAAAAVEEAEALAATAKGRKGRQPAAAGDEQKD